MKLNMNYNSCNNDNKKHKVFKYLLPENITKIFQCFKKINYIITQGEKTNNEVTKLKRGIIKIQKMNNFILAVILIIVSYYCYVYVRCNIKYVDEFDYFIRI